MRNVQFPVIDPAATGRNIIRLRKERGLTVRDIQNFFGFEEPRAIYKWQRGESLPTVDNLFALGKLLGVSMEDILIPIGAEKPVYKEQQVAACCSFCFFFGRLFGIRQNDGLPQPFYRASLPQCRKAADATNETGSKNPYQGIGNRRTCFPSYQKMERWECGNGFMIVRVCVLAQYGSTV